MGLFITASTVQRAPHLLAPERRTWFTELLRSRAADCGIRVVAWVVLKEHYHVGALPEEEAPVEVNRWLTAVHSESSLHWNQEEGCPGRQVWYQFWDRTLWTEGDFWSRVNYIHQNPVKHGYVAVAAEYEWCSLRGFEERSEPRAEVAAKFPAPRKLPGDDF
jgi:putative transposase